MKEVIKFNTGEAKFSYQYGLGLIKLSGEIDFAAYHLLKNYINFFLKIKWCPIIFDLSNVVFMDNTGGIRLLVYTGKRLGFHRIALVNPNSNIERLLKLSRLTEYVFLCEDINRARNALSAGAITTKAHQKSA